MAISLVSELYHYFKNFKVRFTNPTLVVEANIRLSNNTFGEHVFLGKNTEVYNSFIDSCTYIGSNSVINRATIGKFCSISSDVKIGLGSHPYNKFVSTSPYFYAPLDFKKFSFADKLYFQEHKDTIIGNDVWIGANVILMDGVKLGNGTIIAAGAVVTKDVNPYEIVGGIPAKRIKQRFDDEDIIFLENFKWWRKDFNWLRENFKKLHDLEALKRDSHG